MNTSRIFAFNLTMLYPLLASEQLCPLAETMAARQISSQTTAVREHSIGAVLPTTRFHVGREGSFAPNQSKLSQAYLGMGGARTKPIPIYFFPKDGIACGHPIPKCTPKK